MPRSDGDFDELQSLSVPTHRIRKSRTSTQPSHSSDILRNRVRPVSVVDYQAVIRQIERKNKRRIIRESIVAEEKRKDEVQQFQMKSLFCASFFVIPLAMIGLAIIYAPERTVGILQSMQTMLGL